MSRLWLIAFGLIVGCFSQGQAWAGQYRLAQGQPNRVPVGIDVRNNETLCNVEMRIDDGPPFQQQVSAPDFLAWLVLSPMGQDSIQISWRGVPYRTENGELYNPCPTMGSTRFMVGRSNADIAPQWQAHWQALGPAMSTCMQTAFGLLGVRTDWYDRRDPVVSPHDRAIDRAGQVCRQLQAMPTPWGNQPRLGHACTMGGRATRCDGHYSAAGGKGPRLDEKQAIARLLQGGQLSAGHIESPAVIAARIRAEKAAQAKAEAEEAARVEAFKLALAEQKKREQAEEEARQKAAEEERQRKVKLAQAREREYLENRPWLVRKLSRIQPKPLEEDEEADPKATDAKDKK